MWGLLSLFHVILDSRLDIILRDLPIDQIIINALLKKEGILGQLLTLAEAYENVDEKQIIQLSSSLKINYRKIANCYLRAIQAADKCCELI